MVEKFNNKYGKNGNFINQMEFRKKSNMHPFQALRRSILEELEIDHSFHPFLEIGVELLKKGHLYYRTYRNIQLYQEADKAPHKGHPAIYGAALHLLHGNTQIGAYAVNIALITKCAEDLLIEYRQLDEHYQKLKGAIHWQYPIYHPVQWKYEKEKKQIIDSSPLYFFGQLRTMRLVKQILLITACIVDVFKQLFKLSMCLCDAYLLFHNDPQMHYEACTELVAKWDHYQNELKANHHRLMEEMEKRHALANRILKHLGISDKSTAILNQLKDKINKQIKENKGILTDLYHVAEETLDTIYVKGKITPLHIDLTAVHAKAPTIPYHRFVPWAGQNLVIEQSPPFQSPFKNIEDILSHSKECSLIINSLKKTMRLVAKLSPI